MHSVPWIILLRLLLIANYILSNCEDHIFMCVLIRFFGFDYSLLTVDCYGPYTAKDGVCKFNGTVTSQCPSGSGVPRAYHAKNAYAVGQTVSTTYPPQNYIFYFLYV